MYILIILAAMLLSVCFVTNKLYERRAGSSLAAGLTFNALLGALCAVVFFFIGGLKFEITLYSALLAVLLTVLVMSYTLIGFRILKDGTVAIYSIFLMTGGMCVPFVFGILFLHEELKITGILGLLVLIFAVAVSGGKSERGSVNIKKILMCVAVFFLNGFVSVVSKIHQIETERATVGAEQFVILSALSKLVIALLVLGIITLIAKTKNGENNYVNEALKTDGEPVTDMSKRGFSLKAYLIAVMPIIVLAAVCDGVSYFLQLKSAEDIPATVLYPLLTGVSMIFSAAADFAVFKIKPSRAVIISVALSLAGTVLMFL